MSGGGGLYVIGYVSTTYSVGNGVNSIDFTNGPSGPAFEGNAILNAKFSQSNFCLGVDSIAALGTFALAASAAFGTAGACSASVVGTGPAAPALCGIAAFASFTAAGMGVAQIANWVHSKAC